MSRTVDASRDRQHTVVRKLAPVNLAIGAVAVVGAAAMAHMFWTLRHVPVVALPLATVIALGGVFLLARPFAEACAACGAPLTMEIFRFPAAPVAAATAALRSGDVGEALRALRPAPAGGDAVELLHCGRCGAAAVWKAHGAPVVLGGDGARALADALAGVRDRSAGAGRA